MTSVSFSKVPSPCAPVGRNDLQGLFQLHWSISRSRRAVGHHRQLRSRRCSEVIGRAGSEVNKDVVAAGDPGAGRPRGRTARTRNRPYRGVT